MKYMVIVKSDLVAENEPGLLGPPRYTFEGEILLEPGKSVTKKITLYGGLTPEQKAAMQIGREVPMELTYDHLGWSNMPSR
jgi:hypothetical protein